MRKYLLIIFFSVFSGCGSVRDLLRPIAPGMFRDTTAPVVAPGFTLQGRAAKAQDSLAPRLQWISSQKPPPDFSLERIAFSVQADSTLALELSFLDQHRLNSHGLSRDQARERMRERLRETRPLFAKVRESGLSGPVRLRSRFRSKDFLFQNARWVDDTASIVVADSLPLL